DTATLDGSDGSQGELSEARWAEQVAKEPFDLLLETMPGRVNEFLLQGRPKLIEPMLGRLFKDFQGRDPLLREKVLAAWRNLLKSVPSGFQGDLTKRSEEHTSELQSRSDLVCRLLLEKKKNSYSRLATDMKTSTPQGIATE